MTKLYIKMKLILAVAAIAVASMVWTSGNAFAVSVDFLSPELFAQQQPDTPVANPPDPARSTNPPPPAAEQQATQPPAPSPVEGQRVPGVAAADAPQAYFTYKTPYEFWLTGLTIGLMTSAIILLCLMGWRSALTQEFTRTFIIVVVVFAALFLIAAGYSDKQAAPVYSLLGTIIGYIFGRMSSGEKDAEKQAPPAPQPNLSQTPPL